jgi:ubiquinone/menaquinone biosynthesis C-methylase UbiE
LTAFKAPNVIWEIEDPIRLQGERRRAEITTIILKPKRDNRILDVGCGEGYQASYIVGRCAQLVGVDLSAERLKQAKNRVRNVDLVCASSERLPFRPRIFDRVICLELLEHLNEPRKTILEIEYVLKDAGTFVVSVPYKQRIIATRCIHCGKLTPLWGHVQSFDEQKLSSLLPSNFETVKRVYTGTVIAAYPLFGFLPIKVWKLIDDLSKVLPGIKPSWFISKILKRTNNH